MSEAIAFDAHRFVKRLTDCGFTEQQAETLADEQVALLNANLATKAGMEAMRQETRSGIDAVRQENATAMARVETRMESIKFDLMKWMIGLLIA